MPNGRNAYFRFGPARNDTEGQSTLKTRTPKLLRLDLSEQAKLLARIEEQRRRVNLWLKQSLRFGTEVPPRLARAMRYAVLGPGKRLRPILALEGFRAAGGRQEEWVVPFCCGIEMIHASTLVHDDLPCMDNDDFRRGRLSLHRKYDEATATLAAGALLALAFELFATSKAPDARRQAAELELARALGPAGMAGGQLLDVSSSERTTAPKLNRIQQKKTAGFIASSLVCGAILAGSQPDVVSQLKKAGQALGRLFQMTDDMLDALRGDRVSKATMVRVYGLEGTKQHAVSEMKKAEKMLQSFGPGFGVLAGFPRLILERTQ